jgi:peptidoglycan/xylan/chitin deacetylase (PgdA/CDA1 family)
MSRNAFRKRSIRVMISLFLGGLLMVAPAHSTSAAQPSPHHPDLKPTQLAQLHPDWMFLHGDRSIREVALTFDDGPDPISTPAILEILKKERVHATFFVTGKQSLRYPQILKRIQTEGHEIGNHSYDHANFKKLPLSQTQGEVEQTDRILKEMLGHKPTLFRAPYGNLSEDQLQQIVLREGYKVIGWDVDSIDWKAKNPNSIVQTILAQVHPGSIILEHSLPVKEAKQNATIQSLPVVIRSLRDQGYTFVTVSQLLQLDPYAD